LAVLADNIMIVQQVAAQGALRRVLAVLKMRFSGYDATLRELVIDDQGVRVLPATQSAPGVLVAAADASGLTAPPPAGSRRCRRHDLRRWRLSMGPPMLVLEDAPEV
jgi:hypothetical protein